MTGIQPLTDAPKDQLAIRAEARVAAQAAAFHTHDDRDVIHSYLGGWVGADWDLEAVLDLIVRADLVEWRKNALDHDLYISTTSAETAFSRPRRLAYTFDVPMPS